MSQLETLHNKVACFDDICHILLFSKCFDEFNSVVRNENALFVSEYWKRCSYMKSGQVVLWHCNYIRIVMHVREPIYRDHLIRSRVCAMNYYTLKGGISSKGHAFCFLSPNISSLNTLYHRGACEDNVWLCRPYLRIMVWPLRHSGAMIQVIPPSISMFMVISKYRLLWIKKSTE